METILRGLLSGFIIGVVCVAYVLLRTWRLEAKLPAREVETMQSEFLTNSWMTMAFFSSASLLWGFIGAGIYRLLEDEAKFLIFSFTLGVFLAGLVYWRNGAYKLDKIILTLIITIGLGVLVPNII